MRLMVVCLFYFLPWVVLAAVKPTIKVVAPEFEGFASADGTGVIVESGKNLFKRIKIPIDLMIENPQRAVKIFFDGDADCFLGGSLRLFEDYGFAIPKLDLVESQFLYISLFTLMALKQDQIQGLKVVAGKRVGIFEFEKHLFNSHFKQPVLIQNIKTREQGYKLLEEKKIDFFFDVFPVLPKYFEKVNFTESMVLYRAKQRVICHGGSQMGQHMADLDREIKIFKRSGELSEVLTKYYGSHQLRHIKLSE